MKILTFIGLTASENGPAVLDLEIIGGETLQFAISRTQIFALNEQAVQALLHKPAHGNYPEVKANQATKETESGA